jgi:hypothetical protein
VQGNGRLARPWRDEHSRAVLSQREIDRFVRDGFIAVRGAIEPDVIGACRDVVWERLEARGIDRRDRRTWREPLVRLWCPTGGPFVAAGTAPLLREAYDQLIGPRAWVRRRGVGGTIPVRFPHRRRPIDAVWHLDASYAVRRQARLNVRTRGRGLLALFLLSRTRRDDAPTRLLVGSHLDVPAVLKPARDKGMDMWDVMAGLPRSTFRRDVALATGNAGDVILCHPFLVHATSWPNRGPRPRLLIQPAIELRQPLRLDPHRRVRPVERAILRGLGREPSW